MNSNTCTPVVIQGSHREIGHHFGELSRSAFPPFLLSSSTWKALQHWRGNLILNKIRDNVMKYFPWIWDELEGMATSLEMDVMDLLLWNSRGDLLHCTQDGCTSVTTFSMTETGNGSIATPACGHNEDGDPILYAECHMVDVRPLDSPRFVSFFYPGSIPGHSFGFNAHHIMHTVNNLRMKVRPTSDDVWQVAIPRMVISRALMSCVSMKEAVDFLHKTRPIGGFHYTLCQMSAPAHSPPPPAAAANDLNSTTASAGAGAGAADTSTAAGNMHTTTSFNVLSIEHTAEKLSIIHLQPGFQFVHSNHTVHDDLMSKMSSSAKAKACDNANTSTSSGHADVCASALPVREIYKFVDIDRDSNREHGQDDGDSVVDLDEVVSLSSFTRYQRASSIVLPTSYSSSDECGDNDNYKGHHATGSSTFSSLSSPCMDPLIQRVLTDTTDEEVNNCPIFRQQPNDPDEENTIVSVAFTVVPAPAPALSGGSGGSSGGCGGVCEKSAPESESESEQGSSSSSSASTDAPPPPPSSAAAREKVCQMSVFNFRDNTSGAPPLITLTL